MSLQISIREVGGVTVVDLCGKATIDGESEILSRRLKKLVAGGAHKVLLNLADLTQMDSSGIGVVIDTVVSLNKRGGALKLLHPRGRVLEVLRVLRLTEIVPCFENESEALASFHPHGQAATI